MNTFEVEYFEKDDGTFPVEEFILQQPIKMQQKINVVLDALEEYGNALPQPYSEYLEDGILQIRVKQGNNIVRVLYFFFDKRKVILTNGFVKKTQKTPKKELALAKKRRDEYYRRIGNGKKL